MIIDLYRGEITQINENGDKTILSAEIADEQSSDRDFRVVDVPVPIGAASGLGVGDEILVSKTPAEDGVLFDLVRPAGKSFQQRQQDRIMRDLLRHYDTARRRGLPETPAYKFAVTATIQD